MNVIFLTIKIKNLRLTCDKSKVFNYNMMLTQEKSIVNSVKHPYTVYKHGKNYLWLGKIAK